MRVSKVGAPCIAAGAVTWRTVLICAFLLGGGLGTGVAWCAVGLLERPALPNARAGSAVLLAVARTGNAVIAVGEQGIVLVSANDGATWQQAQVPSSVALTNVRFGPDGRAWAVGHGGVVLASDDGGKTWTKRFDGLRAAREQLRAAQAVSADGGGSAAVRLAEAERLAAEGADKPFFDIHFFDDRNGLVVGAYGLAFATRDGGENWESIRDRIDNPTGRHLYAIEVAGSEIYLVGEQGTVCRSIDGGRHFAAVASPYPGSFFGAISTADGALVVFGLRGHAYTTRDGGANWHEIDTGQSASLTAATRLGDGSLLLADESGRLFRSATGSFRFGAFASRQAAALTGVAQAADGGLILSSVRGIHRIAADELQQGSAE